MPLSKNDPNLKKCEGTSPWLTRYYPKNHGCQENLDESILCVSQCDGPVKYQCNFEKGYGDSTEEIFLQNQTYCEKRVSSPNLFSIKNITIGDILIGIVIGITIGILACFLFCCIEHKTEAEKKILTDQKIYGEIVDNYVVNLFGDDVEVGEDGNRGRSVMWTVPKKYNRQRTVRYDGRRLTK